MQTISIPKKPKYVHTGDNSGKFVIEGCYPGYGTTLGNSLRRVLLSSLDGAAATSLKIKGVSHEFSTIDGVMEDVVQIILNLKLVRFKMFSDEPVKVSVKHKGEGEVTAKMIKCSSNVEVINGDQILANLTSKDAELDMEIEVGKGIGYVPVEQTEKDEKEIGVITLDAIYTPIKRVNYEVENMRVGKRTDFDKITLEIITDGSLTPEEAFLKANKILMEQFAALSEIGIGDDIEKVEKIAEVEIVAEEEKEEVEDPKKIKIEDLKNISTRTLNVLQQNKISKVSDILKFTEDDFKELEGMGEKGVKEVKKVIGGYGLTLRHKK
ncbi:MAG: DNA-directed RNA polymerase subunit alpha [Parcubacteria group bacterium Athens0714_25]|nr:MAG: DNA-directed RNA polymerase subunit alpha [Parcubacteria group bacterium Athens0714_25]